MAHKRTLTLAAALLVLTARASLAQDTQPKLADTLEQRLAACAICHGKQGEGKRNEYYPRLAGKPSHYLYLQLVNFRDGNRKYPQMIYLMRYMTDAYLQEVADYYSKLRPPFLTPLKPNATAAELARGELLVTKGDTSNRIPACNGCHGKALTGTLPAIPGLVGLHSDYINSQLGAWRTRARVATEPDCMHDIATRMSGADMSAVAKWLASQPGTPTTLPAPEPAHKLPLECGSQSR